MTVAILRYKGERIGLKADGVDEFLPDGSPKGLRILDLETVLDGVKGTYTKPLLARLKDGKSALRIDDLIDIIEVEEDQLLMLPPLVQIHMAGALDSRVIYREGEQVMLLVDPDCITSQRRR